MKDFLQFVENKNTLQMYPKGTYAVILGEQPSKGAKSPTLWNAAFESLNISARMVPMDVSQNNLRTVIDNLRQDLDFIGGAVTMPYKQTVCEFLDGLDEEARTIGSVNCLYKKNGKLIGSNTDGAGALRSLEQKIGGDEYLRGKTVLILGLGGAGKAVATFVAQAIGQEGTLILANRTHETAQSYKSHLEKKCRVVTEALPAQDASLAQADIIINCTSVGFSGARTDDNGKYYLDSFTPLGDIPAHSYVTTQSDKQAYVTQEKNAIIRNYEQSLENLLRTKKETLVYDIVYQPKQTLLLTIANSIERPTLNGIGMNLEQAVIAFEKTIQEIRAASATTQEIRSAMENIW